MHSHEPLALPLGIRVSQPAVSRQAPGLGGRGEQATQVSTRTAQLAPEQLLSDIPGYFCQLPMGTCQEHLPATEQLSEHLPSVCAAAAARLQHLGGQGGTPCSRESGRMGLCIVTYFQELIS